MKKKERLQKRLSKLMTRILIISLISISLAGCKANLPVSSLVKRTDDEPSFWEVERDIRWVEIKTGEIKNKIVHRSSLCNQWPSCNSECLYHNSYLDMIFKDGETHSIGRIKDNDIVTKGQYGTLYKYDIGSPDNESWFQWIYKKSSQKKIIKIAKELPKQQLDFLNVKINTDVEYESPPKYSWQGLIFSPPAYKTVLVKFKNGLVTTAYITTTGDWKSEMDRKKLSGGIALKNISQWKIVDLE